MADWELLDEKSEAELHKNRLLFVEYRPFRRIVDRLAAISSVVNSTIPLSSADALPRPNTPVGSTAAADAVPDFERLREDVTIDFALFDNTILRLQYLHNANQRERERYQADQERILRECASAVETNTRLREQLGAARATLAQRRRFDDMADRITSNRLLRPREDQLAALAKLEEECRELERESQTYGVVWGERRDQFNRIMEEGMLLRRQIRDEKEEVDRREGMDEGGDDDAGGTGHTPRPDVGTPAQESGEEQHHAKSHGGGIGGGSETPLPGTASHAGTPMRESPGPAPSHLHPNTAAGTHTASASRLGSQQPSPEGDAATPAAAAPYDGDGEEEGEEDEVIDEVMNDDHEATSKDATEVSTPQVAIEPSEANTDRMDVDN